MPAVPAPSVLALMHTTSKLPPSKPAGTYRPQGARGLAAPSIFKREDEGSVPHSASNGSFTPPRGYIQGPVPGVYPNGHSEQNGRAGGGGVAGECMQSARPVCAGWGEAEEEEEGGQGCGRSVKLKRQSLIRRQRQTAPSVCRRIRQTDPAGGPGTKCVPPTPMLEGGTLDPISKKIQNLNKKARCSLCWRGRWCACGLTGTFVPWQIKAIEELKEKTKRGERLEVTQLKKMDTEADIRQELDALLLSHPASLSAAA